MVASHHPFSLYSSIDLYHLMTGQQELIERRSHLTLNDKLHLMAETLRNCTDLKQGNYCFYEQNTKGEEQFCAMGALGFRAGIPKNDLVYQPYAPIMDRYGLTEDERNKVVKTPLLHEEYPREQTIMNGIWMMNDHGKSFNEIADWLDSLQG